MITRMISVGILAVALFIAGCTSPAQEAQKMYDAGQYEQLIAKFSSDPSLASLVGMAKEKIAEKMVAEGKYTDVLEKYGDTKAAKDARNKLADQLFVEGKYDELMSKYGDTPAAMKAKLAMAQAQNDSLTKTVESKDAKIGNQQATIEEAARRELQRINLIANPRLRDKSLAEFLANPKFKGTKAVAEAKAGKK